MTDEESLALLSLFRALTLSKETLRFRRRPHLLSPMAEFKEIAVANLKVDQLNPRLADPKPTNQHDTLRAMAEWDPPKLQAIAQDIAKFGLDPSNLMIVIQEDAGSKFYIVQEGNRRLTAIRALTHPTIIDGVVPASVLGAIKAASPTFLAKRVERVTCVVVKDRAEARHWIEVRHQGIQRGAGTVPWDSVQSARWAAQFGGKKKSLGLLVIELLARMGVLDAETGAAIEKRFPLSTLDRLLANPDVRKVVGIEKSKEKDELVVHYPDVEVAKPLAKMVGDIAHRRIKVSHVDNARLMKRYVAKFDESELPDTKTRLNRSCSWQRYARCQEKNQTSHATFAYSRHADPEGLPPHDHARSLPRYLSRA